MLILRLVNKGWEKKKRIKGKLFADSRYKICCYVMIVNNYLEPYRCCRKSAFLQTASSLLPLATVVANM